MTDRLTSMAVFVKATDLGSLTAAATALGMSSQMAGKHVRSLEDRLGTPLMRRSTRRQSLTDAGRLFYERCRRVLSEVDAAEAVVEDVSATPRGRLRISAPVGFGTTRLAPVLIDLMARHAGLEIELVLTDRYVDPVDEGYDAVIRLGPIAETSLVARELVPHRQVVCASPAYLAEHGAPESPENLADHACLGFVNASGLPYTVWRFTENGADHAVRIRSRFQVNDGRVLAAAAVAGHGIVLQPEAVLRDAIERGSLVPVLTDYQAPGRSMFLIFTAGRHQPPKLRALIDEVVKAYPPPTTRLLLGKARMAGMAKLVRWRSIRSASVPAPKRTGRLREEFRAP